MLKLILSTKSTFFKTSGGICKAPPRGLAGVHERAFLSNVTSLPPEVASGLRPRFCIAALRYHHSGL